MKHEDEESVLRDPGHRSQSHQITAVLQNISTIDTPNTKDICKQICLAQSTCHPYLKVVLNSSSPYLQPCIQSSLPKDFSTSTRIPPGSALDSTSSLDSSLSSLIEPIFSSQWQPSKPPQPPTDLPILAHLFLSTRSLSTHQMQRTRGKTRATRPPSQRLRTIKSPYSMTQRILMSSTL